MSAADDFARVFDEAMNANTAAGDALRAVMAGQVMPDGTPITDATIGPLMEQHRDELEALYGGEEG